MFFLPSLSSSRAPSPTATQSSCASVVFSDDNNDASWDVIESADTSANASDFDLTADRNVSDCAAGLDDRSFDTDAFPMYAHLFPLETNGTWRTETAYVMRHPSTVNWSTVGSTLQDLAISASDQASEAINRACEGHDVVEMGNRVVDLIPRIPSMPTILQVERTVDRAGEAVQDFAHRCRHPLALPRSRLARGGSLHRRSLSAPQLQIEQKPDEKDVFLHQITVRAREALVSQHILTSPQVPAAFTPGCKARLSDALYSFFDAQAPNYGAEVLSDMIPVWIGDMEKDIWMLALDTGLVEQETEEEDSDVEAKATLLEVGFGLKAVQAADEDEWVDVE